LDYIYTCTNPYNNTNQPTLQQCISKLFCNIVPVLDENLPNSA
jgi:hypothetical protein